MAIPGDRKVDGPELGLQAASLALHPPIAPLPGDPRPPLARPVMAWLGTWPLHA